MYSVIYSIIHNLSGLHNNEWIWMNIQQFVFKTSFKLFVKNTNLTRIFVEEDSGVWHDIVEKEIWSKVVN